MELSFMEKQEIEKQVTSLLTQYQYSFKRDDYVDIVDFVQKLGFTVGNAVCLQLASIFKAPIESVSRRIDEVFM